MADPIFTHRQSGPYNQQARIMVNDGGNGLPVHIAVGDDHTVGDISMSVTQAEIFNDKLKKAIKKAKKAGLA